MKKIENIGIETLVTALDNLNPSGSFKIVDWSTIAVKGIDPREVKYPEGYYYNEKNGITNKHNTFSGFYESFYVITD